VLPFTLDTELVALPDVLLHRSRVPRLVVHPYVENVHPELIFCIVAADVCTGSRRLHNYGNAVQFRVTRVKNVAGHSLLTDGSRTVFVKSRGQICRYFSRRPALDLMAMNEVHYLAVSKQRHRRTAWLVLTQILTCS
jgi:hypothetical protein